MARKKGKRKHLKKELWNIPRIEPEKIIVLEI
jgi:hypothetical protein